MRTHQVASEEASMGAAHDAHARWVRHACVCIERTVEGAVVMDGFTRCKVAAPISSSSGTSTCGSTGKASPCRVNQTMSATCRIQILNKS